MRVVVTGALGHIGSRLIRELPTVLPGVEIVMIDNLLTQRYCSLFDLAPAGAYRFVEADILTADLPAVLDGADVVVHLAAITDAAGSFGIAEQVERVNLFGTELVARACVGVGCAMVFLSTTSVYGTQQEVVDESCGADELRPQSPYAASKLKAEQLLQSLGRSDGLRFITCRFGTIFGWSVGMRFHTAINKFCWQAVMELPVTVWRTALNQQRPYLELGDAVGALRFLLEKTHFDQQIYNVVSVNATVGEVLDVLRRRVPDLEIQYVDSPIMNQLSYHVANSKFERLGFQFRGRLESGIVETLQHLWGLWRRTWEPELFI